MILIMLFGITLLIAVTDMSKTWLDDETENILYYDTTVSDENPDDEDTAVSSSQADQAVQDTIENDHMMEESNDNVNTGEASLEEQLLNELNMAMGSSSTQSGIKNNKTETYDLDLDSLDFDDDEDEVMINTRPQSDEEIERDAKNLFDKFKDMTL